MESYELTENLNLIGIQVTTFPSGVKEAFGSLMKTFGTNRDYYGISWMDEANNIIYYAMAKQTSADEAPHNFQQLVVRKGVYNTEAIHNWMSKTDCIKDVLQGLMGDTKPDKNHPCIEWYRSEEEMLCMVKAI